MFCPKCGNELPDSATFCNKCGAQTGARPQPKSKPDINDAASDDVSSSYAGAKDQDGATLQANTPSNVGASKKPNVKTIAIIAAVVVALIVIIAVAAGSCSPSKPAQTSQAQPSSSASVLAEEEDSPARPVNDHVTMAEVAYMSDVELASALEDEGYDRSTSNGATVFKKNGRRIDIDAVNGWRGFYLDSGDIAEVMKDELYDCSLFTEYSKSGAAGFAIAICDVEGPDGLVIGSGKGAILYKPGYMSQVKNLLSEAPVEYYMSAQDAAAAFAATIEGEGYSYDSGDKIDTSSFANETAGTSSSNGSSTNSASSSANTGSTTSANTSQSQSTTQDNTQTGGSTSTTQVVTSGTTSSYAGTWVDPTYGDTMAIDPDGRCNIIQDGNRSIWQWTETSSGIRITNANGTYDFEYGLDGSREVLYNNDQGLYFVKR